MDTNNIKQMDTQNVFVDDKLLPHRNQWNRQSTSTIKMPMLSVSARNSPVSNQRHRFNLSSTSLTSAISQTNNNYPSILDALDMDSLEDMLLKVCLYDFCRVPMSVCVCACYVWPSLHRALDLLFYRVAFGRVMGHLSLANATVNAMQEVGVKKQSLCQLEHFDERQTSETLHDYCSVCSA